MSAAGLIPNETVMSAGILLMQAFESSSLSKAMSRFLNMAAPSNKAGVLLQRTVIPLQTSARTPSTFPSFPTKDSPSPLFRMILLLPAGLMANDVFSRLSPVTVPSSSPMDLAESRDAHFPLFPSRNSSVYPRLKVLPRSGVKPPLTLPKDARRYFPPDFPTILSRAREYALTVFLT